MKHVRPACILFLFLTVVTGVVYPLIVTVVSQMAFPFEANGSLLVTDDTIRGSEIIGQAWSAARYFHGRPSATTPFSYNASASGGSNLALSNPEFASHVRERVQALRGENQEGSLQIPIDLVTASGSGLDPHISPQAARYQIARIALARSIDIQALENLVSEYTEGRSLGIFGEPRVNVLKINMALDRLYKS